MRGEEGDGHGCGEGEVRGVGSSGSAQEVADGADDEHAERNGGEGAAEESHGGSGEVEEMAEGEVVELGIGGDEGSYVGAGGRVGGGDGEVSADEGNEGGEGDQEVEGPLEGAGAGGCAAWDVGVGAGEQGGGHQGKCGERGEAVVLLAAGEGEEAEDDDSPEDEGEGGLVLTRGSCSAVSEGADVVSQSGGEKCSPGHDPEGVEEPEEGNGDLAIVVGDAAAEEAGDVLVIEIEPGPASGGGETHAGGEWDGRGAEGGEDVPGGGYREEDGGARQEVEFWEEVELLCDGQVEEDEGYGEDEADESLGEDVEGHDGGEGEAGEEGGSVGG